MRYDSLSKQELEQLYKQEQNAYADCKAKGLKLDISRGKPGREQLDLSLELLNNLKSAEDCIADGFDVRNYGLLDGIPACKRLFAEILNVDEAQIFLGGNASLQLMYDTLAKAYTHGLLHSPKPWSQLDKVKFLCPVPGYDRHFGISETFNMEMISIKMNDDGPDIEAIEEAVKDPSVKGIWCVPKFSNPQGVVYSEAVIKRLAALRPAAPDFIIMWDNAYCIHEFDGPYTPIAEILALSASFGNPDMVFEFASTSKITMPGAGVAVIASSKANITYMKKLLSLQTISYDKVNQLRHVRFLKDMNNSLAHMQKHAAILKPRFEAVLGALSKEIEPLGIASWNHPKGGYFVSLDTLPGCAKRTYELCLGAGLVMTTAGATHPYGLDPEDKNIRIAPSYPPIKELEQAIEVFCVCLKLAALEKLLQS